MKGEGQMSIISIGMRQIGPGCEPFVIAEMSGNHNQSLDRALALVDAAADAGADGLKLQTYTADTLTIPGIAKIEDPKSLWFGKTLHELYQEAYTPWEWHQPIFERARKRGMVAFSTPFDPTAVDFLEELETPLYKIASFENADWALLKKIASTKKPIIMSTGASTLNDLAESVKILRDAGCRELILLKCTSSYPAVPLDSNILTIPHLAALFECQAGLSDHTGGVGVAVASVALGATVIEKHLTLSRADGGVDSAFSLEPQEFRMLKEETTRAFQGLGKITYQMSDDESKSTLFRRSVYVVRPIAEGEELTPANVRVIRPGDGLKPKYLEAVIGRRARKAIPYGTPLSWDLLV